MSTETILQHVRELKREQLKLLDGLERSILLEQLWPDAFDKGSVKSQVTGSFYNRLTFRIERQDGSGDAREFPLEEVPVRLWPPGVIKDIKEKTIKGGYARKIAEIYHAEVKKSRD